MTASEIGGPLPGCLYNKIRALLFAVYIIRAPNFRKLPFKDSTRALLPRPGSTGDSSNSGTLKPNEPE